jgi:hypothetical protein
MDPATHARDRPLISSSRTLPPSTASPASGGSSHSCSPVRPSDGGLSCHKSRNRRRVGVVVRPISVRARCSESHSRFGTLNKMGEAYQRIMLVGSPRTRSARRRRGLSLASCHCGAVTFNVDAELQTKAVSCNCSSCRQKGLLLSFFSADKFTLTSGENAMTTYEFYAYKIAHRFPHGLRLVAIFVGEDPGRLSNARA